MHKGLTMRISPLISISLFLSFNCYAQLEDKGLLCLPSDKPDNFLSSQGFMFHEDTIEQYRLRPIRDKVEKESRTSNGTFESTVSSIAWSMWASLSDGTRFQEKWYLDRKTLALSKIGVEYQCEVYEDERAFNGALSLIVLRAQKQYDSALEGNRI